MATSSVDQFVHATTSMEYRLRVRLTEDTDGNTLFFLSESGGKRKPLIMFIYMKSNYIYMYLQRRGPMPILCRIILMIL